MEEENTFYEELNTTPNSTQEEIGKRYAERIEEAEEEINNTRRDIDDAFNTLKDELTKVAYDKGLNHGYYQARQYLEETEREKFRKADEEIAGFCAIVLTIATVGAAIIITIVGARLL